MTFVGKILVIVIMAFSILFLGFSTVVFTTSTNWKEATNKERESVRKLQGENNELKTKVADAQKALDSAQADHKTVIAQNAARIKSLEDEAKQLQNEATAYRTKVEVAETSTNASLAEAKQRRDETEQLRTQKSAVEKQANEYKLQQAELNDKIRELERQNATLDNYNRDLRDRVARYSTALRKNGLSDDVTQYKGLESPPAVEGEVLRVDPKGQTLEISIGSDDGLVPNHELYLFRTKPIPEYLGKVRILSVDPDQAVARVIGRTVQGKKIKEGDSVSSTLRPRS